MRALEAFSKHMKKPARKDWLYHFSDRKNLESIRSLGLLSKRIMDSIDVSYHPSGSTQSRESDERSGVLDYVSLSLTPDHPMKLAALRDGRISKAEVLRVNPAILSFDQIFFCPTMANRKDAEILLLDEAVEKGMIDFELLCGDRTDTDPKQLDRLRRCEILVLNCVPSSFID